MTDGLCKTKGLKREGRLFHNRLFQGLALAAVAIGPAVAEDYVSPLALVASKDGATLYITADSYLCRIRTTTRGAGWQK